MTSSRILPYLLLAALGPLAVLLVPDSLRQIVVFGAAATAVGAVLLATERVLQQERGQAEEARVKEKREHQKRLRELADLVTQPAQRAQDGQRQRAQSSRALVELFDRIQERSRKSLEHLTRTQALVAAIGDDGREALSNLGQVVPSVLAVGEQVAPSARSFEDLSATTVEIESRVQELARASEETNRVLLGMDASLGQVQTSAQETSHISEDVTADAERGAEVVQRTISEINRIKESSLEAVTVISLLGSRIETIGQIVGVIEDVAEQTNLLALNAAIIAAQAGEQGRGFAVVADEIKDLAERAGASTREINELIRTVQNESRNAIAAVERGASLVDRGVDVSAEAERILRRIVDSSQRSTSMMSHIARITSSQSASSKQATLALASVTSAAAGLAPIPGKHARTVSTLHVQTRDLLQSIAAARKPAEKCMDTTRSCIERTARAQEAMVALGTFLAQVSQVQEEARELRSVLTGAEQDSLGRDLETLQQELRRRTE
jgi:methyl-accepting chemotaxis protein